VKAGPLIARGAVAAALATLVTPADEPPTAKEKRS
jgi:hypothetical protein